MTDVKEDAAPGAPVHAPAHASAYRIGDWLVETAWNRIRRDGEVVKLEPRVMRLLCVLAAAPGQPLSRQDLLDKVWPDLHVNEDALSRAVSQLRRALGDDPKAPRYVETLHKGGYCLIASVSAVDEGEEPLSGMAREYPRRFLWAALPLLVVILLGVTINYALVPLRQPQALRTLVPLTSEPGREIDPAVSPDARQVAYLASSDSAYQLFIRNIDGGAPLQLTLSKSSKGHPTWSPDGERIAFVAEESDQASIYIVSLKEREAVKLIDLPSWSFGLDWSPDGRTLAYSDSVPGDAAKIVLIDVATKRTRDVAHSDSSAGDVKPVFSPDGKRLAFIRSGSLERQQIVVVDLDRRGQAEPLAAHPQQLRGIDWAPGGAALIFSARSGRRFGLWRVSTEQGAIPETLPAEGGDLFNPSVSADGRIVVEEVDQDSDIWSAPAGDLGAAPLVRSTSDDYEPAYDPAGTRLAFVSERSGAPEVWIQSADGKADRLTKIEGPDIRQISWSADGMQLSFMTEERGASSIYALNVRGGESVPLLTSKQSHIPMGWSENGDALFILAPAAGDWQIEEFRMRERTKHALVGPNVRIAALAHDRSSIFAIPVGKNQLVRIVPGKDVVRQFELMSSVTNVVALLPTADSVYLVEDSLGSTLVHRLDVESGAIVQVSTLSGYRGGAVSLALGARQLVYARIRETGNDLAWTWLSPD